MSHVAIIGAGPYGLAAAASLRAAGVETRIFGETMGFWEHHMPAGMLLRSPEGASNIGDPKGPHSIDAYHASIGEPVPQPVPLERFIDYGRWVAERAVPDVDPRRIDTVRREDGGFLLSASDGSTEHARRVVVAAGIGPFARRPAAFASLPPELVSHSADHRDLSSFAGTRVAVLGAGQSALESAALLSEAGTDVEVIARATAIHWLRSGSGSKLHATLHSPRNPFRSVLFPPSDIGPPGINYLVDNPDLFMAVPSRAVRDRLERRAIRPAGSGWLPARLRAVRISTGVSIVVAEPTEDGLRIRTSDGRWREVDHLLLATGYAIDVARYPFLDPDLVGQIRRVEGYPILSDGFESSVPGLHFLGAPAAKSFSPLMRFVAGSGYTVGRLTRAIRPTALRSMAPAQDPPIETDLEAAG